MRKRDSREKFCHDRARRRQIEAFLFSWFRAILLPRYVDCIHTVVGVDEGGKGEGGGGVMYGRV